MTMDSVGASALDTLPREHRLPVLLLSQYVFFLSRRPISESNLHYLVSRLQGLKSLAPLLSGSNSPVLDQVVSQLGHLHPSAFRRVGPSLQLSLIPLVNVAWPLPPHVVVQDAPPPATWLTRARRALLVFGPGIGIGDELIVAPLPQWLKAANHELSVTTLSGYQGFWNRVHAVDSTLRYASHFELYKALCGIAPFDGYDLVIFVDFESPELYRGVAVDGRAQTFLEISIGARTAHLFDAERQWLYRLSHADPYFANYYHAFHHHLRSLGVPAESRDRFGQVVRRDDAKAPDRLDVFVSPFTSKYDPSGVYWGRLLTSLARRDGSLPLCLHLDTGNNSKTHRFAIELARSVAPMLPPGVEVRLAQDGHGPSLTLPHVYDYLEWCHASVCADSFAAHAGPLFGCLTLVLAKADLKDWQVPSEDSFYFDAESPIDEVAATMGRLLSEMLRPKSRLELSASFSQAEFELCACADDLDEALQSGAERDDAFLALYREFAARHRVVADKRRAADGGDPLFRQSFTGDIRAPGADAAAGMMPHLRDQLARWQNTNFAKYLGRARRHAVNGDGSDDGTRAARGESFDSLALSPSKGEPAVRSGSPIAAALLTGIRSILREQLPSGEIATYFRIGGGGLEYRRSPLVSSFVHDALGSFDLQSRWVNTDVLDLLPASAQGRFVRAAGTVRSRIRTFLAWEEGNDGGWCFHGRASGAGPDLDTTACAAAAVAQAPRRRPATRWQTQSERLLADLVRSDGTVDLITRVNILRFLALVGERTDAIREEVITALRSGEPANGSRYTSRLALHYCVARAWAQAALPGRDAVAELLVPRIVEATGDDVLGTALALNALIDLEYWGAETIAAGQSLLEAMLPRGGWGYASLLENGGGAPACTAALAMAALARSGVGR
jgi:hypothetical protein